VKVAAFLPLNAIRNTKISSLLAELFQNVDRTTDRAKCIINIIATFLSRRTG